MSEPDRQPDTASIEQWICPDLTVYWKLAQLRGENTVVLQSLDGQHQQHFSALEGQALRYFTGNFTLAQVQQQCQQQADIPADFVGQLVQKLLDLGLLTPATETFSQTTAGIQLKAAVHWVEHPDGYWILRNPEDVTFLQVSSSDKQLIEQLKQHSPQALAAQPQISSQHLQYLLRLLSATGMMVGTSPPQPPRKKFTPLRLLFFKLRLGNPDAWLSRHVQSLQGIWTCQFFWALLFLLAFSLVFGLHQRQTILLTGQQLLTQRTPSLMLSFILLNGMVVTLHELGHAFTLKHYRGIVPEVGLMLMMFMPVAYTNTTDQYSLPEPKQRLLVVGAGVLCQLTIAALAFWSWNSTATGSWLNLSSYLLMSAALFTVAVNLNPLARFDGYYLAVALSGINNLRQRSFQFYKTLLSLQPSPEQGRNRIILALYAPFALLYTFSVFGYLLLRVGDWTITHIPVTAFALFTLWALYYFAPAPKASQK